MAGEALRVLALAYREADEGEGAEELEQDVVFLGLVGMMDPPRPEAVDAVRVCREVHMRPVMITGDHKLTALAIAREMGIFHDGDRALTGEELEAMATAPSPARSLRPWGRGSTSPSWIPSASTRASRPWTS
jgi:Ca2+-transporting ATPase